MNKKLLILTLLLYSTSISFINKKDLEKYHVQSGVNITKFANISGFNEEKLSENDKKAFDKLKKLNFSYIVINDLYTQENLNSSKVTGTNYFNEKYLDEMIKQYSNDFSFVLRHLLNSKDKQSRTRIMPNNIEKWSESYNKSVVDMTKKAKMLGIKDINIGSELDSLILTHPEVFESTITSIRDIGYTGSITIATVFSGDNSLQKVRILNNLPIDRIGIDFYVSAKNENLSDDKKFYEYKYYLDKILSESKKSVEICEIGFRSVKNGNRRPMFNYRLIDSTDMNVQFKAYEDFFKAINKLKSNKYYGTAIWITDTDFFSKDILKTHTNHSREAWPIGYTPFNKPAERALKDYNQKRIFRK